MRASRAGEPATPLEVLLAEQQYDVVIIGSGPGGYVAGIRAGQLGLKVAVVEKDPFLGGTCLHRGCIPTKSLLENADVWTKIQKAKEFGITVGDATIDWSDVQKRKQGVVDANAKGIEFLFKKNKVDRITGFGKLVDRNTVDVMPKTVSRSSQTKNIILAMGSVPKDLPHIKADGKRIINSDHILVIDRVPHRCSSSAPARSAASSRRSSPASARRRPSSK